jgi:hypothetical protein
MRKELLAEAMKDWAIYFKRKVDVGLIDIYWQEVAIFSDFAMAQAAKSVKRNNQFFPKLYELIPLLQQHDYNQPEARRERWKPPSLESLKTGFGDYDDRDLLMEAEGLPLLLGNLFGLSLRFTSVEAAQRTVDQGMSYTANLLQGLRQRGDTKTADELDSIVAPTLAKLDSEDTTNGGDDDAA